MAIKFNRSQTFATNDTVTSAKLHNLVDGLDVYQALITDQVALTTVSTADKLLIADADLTANDAPRSVTVQELFSDSLSAGTYAGINLTGALSYGTATGNATISTTATLGTTTATAATITTGTIPNGTFGTTTSTAATITTGTIPTLTIGSTTATAGTITTLNSTTGTITNLSTTLAGDLTISQGTATLGTSGVTAGTYGTSTIVPTIAVDAKGRVTSVGTSAVSSGKILQVVSTSSTAVITVGSSIPRDNTIPQNTEGVEVLTLAITPVSATSTLYISFSAVADNTATNFSVTALFKDSVANALAARLGDVNSLHKLELFYNEASSSTASRTYKIRCGSVTGTLYINSDTSGNALFGGVSQGAYMQIIEVEA